MFGTIFIGDKMKIIKMKSGKYKIKLEDGREIITYDEIMLKYNIILKKELDEDTILKINKDTLNYIAYDKSLKYITTKMRSELEIEKYLNKLGVDEILKKNIIQKLKDNKLIDDEKYTIAFIIDKINLSNIGPNKIKKELLEHNIDLNIIEKELNKYSDNIFEEKIDKYIAKKIKNQKYSTFILKQKIINDLINNGYSLDMIKGRLDNVQFDNSYIIEKDYNKIKKRLSNKFDEKELDKQIKNKLILKGYKIEEINQIIDKESL